MIEGAYTPEVVRIANATLRDSGALNRDPVVYRFARQLVAPEESVLDFGSGLRAVHARKLRGEGYNTVVAWDFGSNFDTREHAADALSRKYDVVLVSNVLNVLITGDAITQAIGEITDCCGGRVLWNYPASPRKCPECSVADIVREFEARGFRTLSPHPRFYTSSRE